MKLNDAISGLLLLALSIAVLVAIQSFPKIPGQNIGPGAFPGLLASLLAFCSLLLIWRGIKERAQQKWLAPGAWLRSLPHLRSFIVTVACLLFYIFLSNTLGFIICGFIVLCAMMWTLHTRPQVFIPVSIVATLVIHTIFYKGLRVPLPWGVMLPIAW
jgi:putative tricarboxylic transport membrane protein